MLQDITKSGQWNAPKTIQVFQDGHIEFSCPSWRASFRGLLLSLPQPYYVGDEHSTCLWIPIWKTVFFMFRCPSPKVLPPPLLDGCLGKPPQQSSDQDVEWTPLQKQYSRVKAKQADTPMFVSHIKDIRQTRPTRYLFSIPCELSVSPPLEGHTNVKDRHKAAGIYITSTYVFR